MYCELDSYTIDSGVHNICNRIRDFHGGRVHERQMHLNAKSHQDYKISALISCQSVACQKTLILHVELHEGQTDRQVHGAALSEF